MKTMCGCIQHFNYGCNLCCVVLCVCVFIGVRVSTSTLQSCVILVSFVNSKRIQPWFRRKSRVRSEWEKEWTNYWFCQICFSFIYFTLIHCSFIFVPSLSLVQTNSLTWSHFIQFLILCNFLFEFFSFKLCDTSSSSMEICKAFSFKLHASEVKNKHDNCISIQFSHTKLDFIWVVSTSTQNYVSEILMPRKYCEHQQLTKKITIWRKCRMYTVCTWTHTKLHTTLTPFERIYTFLQEIKRREMILVNIIIRIRAVVYYSFFCFSLMSIVATRL